VAIGAYRGNGSQLERVDAVRVETTGSRTPVAVPNDAEFLLVNDDDRTFAVTRPVGMGPVEFAEAIVHLPTPTSRGVGVATMWDMLLAGEIPAAAVTRCLLGVLDVETSDAVIERYLTRACEAVELWTPAADSAALTAEVARTCQTLAADAGRRRVALRAFARMAPDLDALEWLRANVGDDIDLHWRSLVRAAELGADTSADVADLQDRDPDPDAWVRALTVQAARPNPDDKQAAWQRVAVDRTVPIGASFTVATAFWRPHQEQLLAPYAQRYLDLLPDLERGGMIPAMSYTAALFPTFGIAPDYLDQVLAAAEQVAPVVRKTAAERVDEVRRMLRSRAAEYEVRG
jgi:aminopeptidase N